MRIFYALDGFVEVCNVNEMNTSHMIKDTASLIGLNYRL